MTLGKKLKEIRKSFGLSQDELAEMMHVSRQAITKWENDNGLPDVSNLQELSKVFGLTVDYLLDDDKQLPALSMRLELNKEDYKNKISMYSEVLKKYFGGADIYVLVRSKRMSFIDVIIDTFTIPWLGPVETADALSDLSTYYLVKKDRLKFLVNIKDYVLEVIELPDSINEKRFIYGKNSFRNTGKIKL